MTRTAIAQNIAKKNNLLWKNIYSGVFRDLDEILIPLNIVSEAGRLPLKRGPKALQEKGVPYYQLTPEGLLVVLSIDDFDQKESILTKFLYNVGSVPHPICSFNARPKIDFAIKFKSSSLIWPLSVLT